MGSLVDIQRNVTNIQGELQTMRESFYTNADANSTWMLQSGYLVFFMQVGFAMLCAGSVRAKNAKNIILLNLLDACLGSLCWYATGFAFAYGDPVEKTYVTDCATGEVTTVNPENIPSNALSYSGTCTNAAASCICNGTTNGVYSLTTIVPPGGFTSTQQFIGNRYFFLTNTDDSKYSFWFFQFTFAATAATIVSGAVAERCRLWAYLSYELILVCFVYPVVAHWVWSESGWASHVNADKLLFGIGVLDFAGDGPVHMVGGFASLAGAWILGPRKGRFDADGDAIDMPGHNASLTLLGVFFLWFGWFGFNPGSTLGISGANNGLAARVAINTTFGAATGALTTLLIVVAWTKRTSGTAVVDLIMVGNGALAGLVSVTGPCGWIEVWASIPIGIIGAFVYFACSKIILHVLKIDDPLDAIAVHAGCGCWGLIGTAAFATRSLANAGNNYGFVMGGNGNLLGCQLVIILSIAAWSLAIMTPFFLFLKKINLLRVPPEVEDAGLDVSHHGGYAYPHEPVVPKDSGTGTVLSDDMIMRKIEELFNERERGEKAVMKLA